MLVGYIFLTSRTCSPKGIVKLTVDILLSIKCILFSSVAATKVLLSIAVILFVTPGKFMKFSTIKS